MEEGAGARRNSVMVSTRPDPLVRLTRVDDDEPIHLREWATDRIHPLPQTEGEHTIGSAPGSWLLLQDSEGFVSRLHATLQQLDGRWVVRDALSKNGLWIDGERTHAAELRPGLEIGVGRLRLIAETPRLVRMRALLSRWVGWDSDQYAVIDRMLRSLRWFAAEHAPVFVIADGDVISLARRIHREMLGDRPFLISDPRRQPLKLGRRSVENYPSIAAGMRAASGGTLCIWASRRPPDFSPIRIARDGARHHTRLMVCAHKIDETGVLAGGFVKVPSLSTRSADLERIVREYAMDAVERLEASPASFTDQDLAWVLDRRPQTLAEIEHATVRRVALREFGGVTSAAEHLGLTHGAFSRWLARRTFSRK